jgi:hypothetical protein
VEGVRALEARSTTRLNDLMYDQADNVRAIEEARARGDGLEGKSRLSAWRERLLSINFGLPVVD